MYVPRVPSRLSLVASCRTAPLRVLRERGASLVLFELPRIGRVGGLAPAAHPVVVEAPAPQPFEGGGQTPAAHPVVLEPAPAHPVDAAEEVRGRRDVHGAGALHDDRVLLPSVLGWSEAGPTDECRGSGFGSDLTLSRF